MSVSKDATRKSASRFATARKCIESARDWKSRGLDPHITAAIVRMARREHRTALAIRRGTVR